MRRSRVGATVGATLLMVCSFAGRSVAAPATRAAAPTCTITGNAGNNVLDGTPGDDVICGLGGNDVITGEGGNDTLIGGAGVDTCIQGPGVGSISGCEALAPISFSIDDASGPEGNPGDANTLSFAVDLSTPVGVTVTVDYTTADGSATAPSDYATESGTLAFAAGVTAHTITVPIVGDANYEPDEAFTVVLSNPTAGTLDHTTATGTITNDDPQYQLNIGDAHGPESKPRLTFPVTITPPSPTAVYVQYQTVDQTASSPADYAGAIGVLAIPAGAASAKIVVPIVNDTINEPTETFAVVLSSPVGATITDGTGIGSIADDGDPLPTLTIADASHPEGDTGTTSFAFTATLSAPSGYTIAPTFTLTPGTALAGYDYENTARLTIPPGATTGTIVVPVETNKVPEHDETFTIKLSGGANLVLNGATATGTILNDDPGVVVDLVSPTGLFKSSGVGTAPAISADGHLVAFVDNFLHGFNEYSILYVRDRTTGELSQVGRSSHRSLITAVAMSGNGSRVAYAESGTGMIGQDGTELGAGDEPALDGDGDELVYRVPGGGIQLYTASTQAHVHVTSDGGASDPAISPSGNRIAFVAGDGSIQVYTVSTATTAVASVASDGTAANAPSSAPSLSTNGRYVLFASSATNLVGGDTNATTDEFRHDFSTGATVRVSVASDGSQLADGGQSGTLSTDGTKVAFVSGNGSVLVHTIGGATVTVVAAAATDAVISNDGTAIAFLSSKLLVDGIVERHAQPQAFVGNL
jgi:Tol biopolymer transport system component